MRTFLITCEYLEENKWIPVPTKICSVRECSNPFPQKEIANEIMKDLTEYSKIRVRITHMFEIT